MILAHKSMQGTGLSAPRADAELAVVPAPGGAAAHIPVYVATPERIAASQMTAFTAALEAWTGQTFPDYEALHAFSVRSYKTFWQCFALWSHGSLQLSGSTAPVGVGDTSEHARLFPQAQLNYADSLLNLSVAPAHAPALTACHADGSRVRWSRGQLRERVARLAQALSALGLREGDRVAGVMRNDGHAVVAALAVTALGATLSTSAPEMGVEAILDRFAPLAPKLLLAHTAARAFDSGLSLADNITALAAALPSLEGIISLDGGSLPGAPKLSIHALDALIDSGDAEGFVWRCFAFNHPLFIMFSSGTTGKPKCIVHGAGGTLLEHLKEHRLHTDLRPGERMYFHTSCAWMMWNWQLSALASGVEIVTYDGPISSVDRLWRLVADERVTVFGTSPAYLRMCEDAGLAPGRQFDLGALRAVLSTGAVLHDAQFHWVRDQVKELPLQSISGGTDIIGCFVLGNPNLPVYAGQAQCRSLGLDVQAWEQGAPASGIGELVCVNPFPSRPLGFFGDKKGAGFHAAYFSRNPGVWTHGDLIEFSAQGAARLHGRFDGMLNVNGINVAPNEIYRVLNDMADIREAMVVEQRTPQGEKEAAQNPQNPQNLPNSPNSPDSARFEQRTVLLLVLKNGLELSGALVAHVRRELARRLSPAHVPDRIVAVDELPFTHNGKPSEAAARSAVNGWPIGNIASLRNPACLEAIRSRTAPGLESVALPASGEACEQLEQQLQTQWEKLFGFAPIGRDDNFFELGGNSLLAARLLAQARQLTGRAFPLATLQVAPTVRRLAALIEGGAQVSSSSILVPIRAGAGAPLFLVHGLSGTVMECWPLVGALRSARPVYGLQAQGLDGELRPPQRVEDMAASYIAQMRSVQPNGPYALIGFSFGGLIALEIAQQLHRAGERIALLCLLDTYVHQNLPWSAWVGHRIAFMGKRLARARRKLGNFSASELLAFGAGKLAVAAGGAPLDAVPMSAQPGGEPLTMPPAQQQVREQLTAAMTAYQPQPYDGGAILFVHAAIRLVEYFDPLPLWRRVGRGGMTVFEVPDSHLDVVGRHADLVAVALDRALADAAPAP